MTATQQDRQIAETMRQQWPRLLQFIRRRIPDEAETQELLQDVFAELVGRFRLLKPVEQTAAWLMPDLFHLPLITLSQTLGFLLLSRILFGGFLQGGPPDGWARRRKEWQQRMADRLQDLSPEDRGKFRQQMRTRCGMGWMRRTYAVPTEPTARPPYGPGSAPPGREQTRSVSTAATGTAPPGPVLAHPRYRPLTTGPAYDNGAHGGAATSNKRHEVNTPLANPGANRYGHSIELDPWLHEESTLN